MFVENPRHLPVFIQCLGIEEAITINLECQKFLFNFGKSFIQLIRNLNNHNEIYRSCEFPVFDVSANSIISGIMSTGPPAPRSKRCNPPDN
jgi:hypothetical protein